MEPKRTETLSSVKKYKVKRKATQPWLQTKSHEKVAQESSFVILYNAKVRSKLTALFIKISLIRF